MDYYKCYKMIGPCEGIDAIKEFLRIYPKSKNSLKVRVLYRGRYSQSESWVNMYVQLSLEKDIGYIKLGGSLDNENDKGNYNAFQYSGCLNDYNTKNSYIYILHKCLIVEHRVDDDSTIFLNISEL